MVLSLFRNGAKRMPTQSWIITTAVGTGEKGYAGDGGPAARAQLNGPFDVGFDTAGNLYFSDTFNHCIRRVDARSNFITTLAGCSEPGYSGDGGPAIRACFNEPYGIAVDRAGNVYVADRHNHCVRRIEAGSGIVTTFAGNGSAGFGDDGPALTATFDAPKELTIDREGNLLIVDTENHAIRKIDTRSKIVATVIGSGRQGGDGDGGPATAASLDRPHGAAVAPDGSIYIGDTNNHRVRKVARAG